MALLLLLRLSGTLIGFNVQVHFSAFFELDLFTFSVSQHVRDSNVSIQLISVVDSDLSLVMCVWQIGFDYFFDLTGRLVFDDM